jgi:hypothetical protein
MRNLLGLGMVLVLFSATTVLFFSEWWPTLSSALIGPPEDNMQDLWNSWYGAFADHSDGFFHTRLIRYPEGTSLLYHSFAYPKVFAVALLTKWLGLDATHLIMLHNLGLLISFPIAGTGAFLLLRHLAVKTGGALLGGFIFAFNPSHIEHVMHHAHVSSIEFIPFFVLAYLLALRRKSYRWVPAAVVLYALNALSCWYYLFYIGYFILFHAAYTAIRDGSLPTGRQLTVPVSCAAGVVLLLSPLLVPMVREAVSGSPVYISGYNKYVADLAAYLSFPQFHFLGAWSEGIYRQLTGNVWEATVYLGVINAACLAWILVSKPYREADLLRYALCGMAVFCIFATGSWLHVLGRNTLPMPGIILSHVPFFKNVRTPSRAIVFVYLFMAAAVGYALMRSWIDAKSGKAKWLVPALAILIVLDFFPGRPLQTTPLVCAPGLAVIKDDPDRDFGVLDLPAGYYSANLYMFQQTCHGRPIVEGNTSRKLTASLRDRLEMNDLPVQRRQLAAAKVKYIIVNRRPMGIPVEWEPANGLQEQLLSFYHVEYDSADLAVLRVY